jgi:Uri superfamily endonuclease
MRRGTYVLVLALEAARAVEVGALGLVRFPPGIYAYVGSAQGLGGLAGRLARHRRAEKTARWHIDYLRPHAGLLETWQTIGRERLECAWAQALAGAQGATVVARGFGASDCACVAHLFHFPSLACLRAARPALGNPEIFPEPDPAPHHSSSASRLSAV